MDEKFINEMYSAVLERTIKRLWALCILLVVLLVGSNLAWLYYENSFEEVVITQENDDGFNNYIGEEGDIFNGNADHQN